MIRAAVIFLALTLFASHAGAGTNTGDRSSGTTVSAQAADLDVPRFLGAIRAVEEWHGRDGRAGERGPWQITRDVWAMHMPGRPFSEARKEGPAYACAVKHLAWLRAGLVKAGTDDNAFNLALCWNAGLTATITGRAPQISYDYAVRVSNLYLKP